MSLTLILEELDGERNEVVLPHGSLRPFRWIGEDGRSFDVSGHLGRNRWLYRAQSEKPEVVGYEVRLERAGNIEGVVVVKDLPGETLTHKGAVYTLSHRAEDGRPIYRA